MPNLSVLAQFNVTLSVAVSEPVSVDWYTVDGTAKAGVDYAGNKGTVVFAPGQVSKLVDILVFGRAVGAEDRSFFVEMLPPTNAVLGASVGECIIHVDTTGSTPVTQIIVPKGPKGDAGKSSYQTWLDLPGNAGKTEQEFIDSLKPSVEEIAEEVAPLINVGDTTLTASGTETLSKPDTTNVKSLARRVAYSAAAKIATLTLAEGDNTIGSSILTGDVVDFAGAGFVPLLMRGDAFIKPIWVLNTDGTITIKSAVAGDALYAIQYNFVSDYNSRSAIAAVTEASAYTKRKSFEKGSTEIKSGTDALLWEAAPVGQGPYYVWSGAFPKPVPSNSTPASAGGVGAGKWLSVRDATTRSWVNANVGLNFNSVTDLIAGTSLAGDPVKLSPGVVATTFANIFGIKQESKWIISLTADASTYSVALSGGGFANLICRSVMNYAEFGFGGTDVQNAAAVDEGNRVARAQKVIRELTFPAGNYKIASFTLDVDKRGFVWSGAGYDSTLLISTTSGLSMHHMGFDPRDRTKDRLHFYQEVKGFMLDGNIDENGANAASRCLSTGHYADLSFKTVGHRQSNLDVSALCVHWKGHSQQRANGSVVSGCGVGVRYNSVKLDGYIGGASSTVACAISGPKTTLSTAAAVGDTAINVASVSGFRMYDIVEIFGGNNLEAPYVVGIAAGILTLDKPLVSAHTSGAAVAVPVVGTCVTGTIEVGQIQVIDATATEIHGLYAEESKIYVSGLVKGLEIHGCELGQASPTIQIDNVDKKSNISVHDNNTSFSIAISAKDKAGAVTAYVDPSVLPALDIRSNTRSQNTITVNGVNAFTSLKVSRTYDSTLTDVSFTKMEFDGLYYERAAGAGFGSALTLTQNATPAGYDGYAIDITAVCKRQVNVTAGLLKRGGGTSTDGSTAPVNTVPIVSSYAQFNATTGVEIAFVSTTTRASIDCRGEAAGGQVTKFSISGSITSLL